MKNIILVGCSGKMGQVVSRLTKSQADLQIVAGLDRTQGDGTDYPVYSNPGELAEEAHVVLDFSSAEGLSTSLGCALAKGLPLVIASTGHSPQQLLEIEKAGKQIPIFRSANLSLGINLLLELVKKAASVLGDRFDMEIIERHHNQKLDAPSGTALMIASAIEEVLPKKSELVYDRHSLHQRRGRDEIGIHAVRGGTMVGEHEILFAGQDETLSITHRAQSKEIFALGALKACEFICTQPAGEYDMGDLMASLEGVEK